MNHKRFSISKRTLGLLLLLVAVFMVYRNFQTIVDEVRLYGYEPSSEIVRLSEATSMTETGRKLFYVNDPLVADKSAFSQYCSSHAENSIILGCYHSKDRGIYLYEVTDTRLTGVEEVTAAHEMLHAAYDRLSSAEQQRIDKLLNDFYQTGVADQRIKDTIAAYQKSEPNDVVNEMHSIFPTEILELPSELETYYAGYFTDRKKVANLAIAYQSEFTSRRDQVKAYDDRLSGLKTKLDANTNSLKSQEAAITARAEEMNNDRASGNIAAYNAQVAPYNAKVQQYNALVVTTQALIAEYNKLVVERNALALEVKDLAKSIDSRPTPL